MVISYHKLWQILDRRGMTKRELIRLAGISFTTVRNMEKGNNVNLDVLRKICEALHVNLGDVAEFVESEFIRADDHRWRNRHPVEQR